jgi:hypothetical protein
MKRILSISAKCNDLCFTEFNSDELNIEKDGYVPKNLGIGGGDFVDLEIDVETGQILNWKALTNEDIQEAFNEP